MSSDDRLMMEKLARALRIYAKPENWGRDDWNVMAVFNREYGKPGVRARETLKKYERYLSADKASTDEREVQK